MKQIHPIKVFSGTKSQYLSKEIAKYLNVELGKIDVEVFSDGEFRPRIEETVRGCIVFIIQSTFQPVDNFFELLLMIDAAKRASAHKVVAVIPYLGFARQDRKTCPRQAIGAKLVSNLLEASGVDRVMTMDLHAGAIQGFFDIPVDHLYASKVFIPYLKNLNLKNLIIASPDMGGTKRAKAYSDFLSTDMVICYKSRDRANHIGEYKIIGDIKDKDVVVIDDMVDTAGTITKAADMMLEEGANSVRVVATHGILSGPAIERIEKSSINEVIITDTIPYMGKCSKIKIISISELFAYVINKVYNYEPISSSFIDAKN